MKSQQTMPQTNSFSALSAQLKQVSDALLDFSPSHSQALQLREQLSSLLTRLERVSVNDAKN